MLYFLFAVLNQAVPFLPLALAIYISFHLLNATDMTLDGSFVMGAGLFAHLVALGFHPAFSALVAIGGGCATGCMVAIFQRHQKIDALLAGILAAFILTGLNLMIMGRPNISLLGQHTLVSEAFLLGELYAHFIIAIYSFSICFIIIIILKSSIGLKLRAFGDNPAQMARYGFAIEKYRMLGFALTNCLAASAGCLTAEAVNYADVGMGFGVTLTGLGAIILGQEIFNKLLHRSYLRPLLEFTACLLGVLIYFFAINALLSFQVDPVYLKIILGLVLVIFLRASSRKNIFAK